MVRVRSCLYMVMGRVVVLGPDSGVRGMKRGSYLGVPALFIPQYPGAPKCMKTKVRAVLKG